MPHAVDEEDELLAKVIAGETVGALEDLNNRDLDIGEKAHDAEDFGDIGDDDLADDEEDDYTLSISAGHNPIKNESLDDSGLFEADQLGEDPFDDLFNSQDPLSSPILAADEDDHFPTQPKTTKHNRDPSFGSSTIEDASTPRDVSGSNADIRPSSGEPDYADEDAETREQRLLFEQARRGREGRMRQLGDFADLPPPPQTDAELFSIIWPQYEADKPPRFGELLLGKRAYYLSKTPLKPPKPVQPTKVSLELQQDQEKSFRLSTSAYADPVTLQVEAAAKGLVFVTNNQVDDQESDEGFDTDGCEDDQPIGGVNWQDLVVLCEEWDIPSGKSSSAEDSGAEHENTRADDLFGDESWETEEHVNARPAKKLKTSNLEQQPLYDFHDFNISFDDPEKATMRIAKSVHLDLNDPHMLIDIQPPTSSPSRKRNFGVNYKRDTTGALTRDLTRRYNISNDDAYEMLKENHQSKIRSTLGNVTVEHALPAIRLQYPFYKVKLSAREARSFHRPTLSVPLGTITFSKSHFVKKKHLRNKDVQSLFPTSRELSLGDNSSILLVEYSEEYPAMISGFGMGNRLVNYYRRKDDEDTTRPKLDIGETAILLPQDKSPFSIFGDVIPGETTPTLHNAMYRAPVFKHEANPNDFIVVRSRTGVDGAQWHLRNVDNLHVIGQEFPSVEVPGTHSRKVTDAAKKRLRMLSNRLYKKYKKLSNEMIRDHLPGSDIAQNRSKMREFMDYDKYSSSWIPKNGDIVPNEAVIRSWIRPEDVCLLDSMQVGERQLQDAGYIKDENDAEREEDDEKSTQTLDQQLAPWQTTKNFLNACQDKAMLQLHGEGDPTGIGEGFSFIRTSMKGGFKEIGESVEDRLDAKKRKENGGHTYNVARQQRAYHEHIRRIWDAQKRSLSSSIEHDYIDTEDDVDESSTPPLNRGRTPSSAFGKSRRDEETGSVFSRTSMASQAGKVCKITRHVKDKYGVEEVQEEIIRDPKVIRQYVKHRRALELASMSYGEMRPTGDEDKDQAQINALAEELARLERNKERRLARQKAKGITDPASPNDAASPAAEGTPSRRNAGGGTQRKCANCGQVGHIKTNKKLCPMLNGTIKQDEDFGDSAFGSLAPVPGPVNGISSGFGT